MESVFYLIDYFRPINKFYVQTITETCPSFNFPSLKASAFIPSFAKIVVFSRFMPFSTNFFRYFPQVFKRFRLIINSEVRLLRLRSTVVTKVLVVHFLRASRASLLLKLRPTKNIYLVVVFILRFLSYSLVNIFRTPFLSCGSKSYCYGLSYFELIVESLSVSATAFGGLLKIYFIANRSVLHKCLSLLVTSSDKVIYSVNSRSYSFTEVLFLRRSSSGTGEVQRRPKCSLFLRATSMMERSFSMEEMVF